MRLAPASIVAVVLVAGCAGGGSSEPAAKPFVLPGAGVRGVSTADRRADGKALVVQVSRSVLVRVGKESLEQQLENVVKVPVEVRVGEAPNPT